MNASNDLGIAKIEFVKADIDEYTPSIENRSHRTIEDMDKSVLDHRFHRCSSGS